jgi:hypothetical protein
LEWNVSQPNQLFALGFVVLWFMPFCFKYFIPRELFAASLSIKTPFEIFNYLIFYNNIDPDFLLSEIEGNRWIVQQYIETHYFRHW